MDDLHRQARRIYGGRGAEVPQSLVQVAALVMPELLVVIEVVAHL